jgi:hypothetical protein
MSIEISDKWLKSLGTLCAGSMPKAEADLKISAYAGLLAERYDRAAFCGKSLEAVAAQSKFWPSYGEVCDRLDAWWAANKPQQLAISHPRALTVLQTAHVACCDRRLSDGADAATVLGVLHAASGNAAITEILRDRPGLVPLCRAKGWLDEFVPLTDDQRARVLEVARAFSDRSAPSGPAHLVARNATGPAREPARLDKLAVARAATPAVLASRPDLRAVLDQAAANEGAEHV